MHADLHRLLSDQMLVELQSKPIERLRQLRTEASTAEGDVSFVRRMAQGRFDIVGHERSRRSGAAEDASIDVSGLLFDMPDILKDDDNGGEGGSRSGRHVEVLEPGKIALELGDQLDAVVSPSALAAVERLSEADLADLLDQLREFEVGLSQARRQLHDRIDMLQDEIARRYRDGEVTVDSVLES